MNGSTLGYYDGDVRNFAQPRCRLPLWFSQGVRCSQSTLLELMLRDGRWSKFAAFLADEQ